MFDPSHIATHIDKAAQASRTSQSLSKSVSIPIQGQENEKKK